MWFFGVDSEKVPMKILRLILLSQRPLPMKSPCKRKKSKFLNDPSETWFTFQWPRVIVHRAQKQSKKMCVATREGEIFERKIPKCVLMCVYIDLTLEVGA